MYLFVVERCFGLGYIVKWRGGDGDMISGAKSEM